MGLSFDSLSGKVIGHAIEVHRILGPGLLESVYEECMAYELKLDNLMVGRQVPVPVEYKNIRLDLGFRIDLLVNHELIVELKSIESITAVHHA